MSNIKFDTDRLNQIIQNSEHGTSSSPSADDVTFFEKEIQNDANSNRQSSDDDSSGNTGSGSPFEGIFQNPFSVVKEQPKVTETASQQNFDTEITDKMIERILVSEPKDGDREIRIKLNDSILKDTEIHLKRLNDGSLQISLNSNNANSLQTLVAQQFELKARLEQIEKASVSVEVNTESQNNDTDQQSRGLYDLYQYYKND